MVAPRQEVHQANVRAHHAVAEVAVGRQQRVQVACETAKRTLGEVDVATDARLAQLVLREAQDLNRLAFPEIDLREDHTVAQGRKRYGHELGRR